MDNRKIITILLGILQYNYLIPPDRLKEENWDIPLTGRRFGLSGFQLAALILEFEKRTGVKIDISKKPMYALANINDIIKASSHPMVQ